MNIKNEIIISFLYCRNKCYQKINSVIGQKTEYEMFHRDIMEETKSQFIAKILNEKKNSINLEGKNISDFLNQGFDYFYADNLCLFQTSRK